MKMEMLSHGLQPDILICRSDKELSQEAREKIALFTNVEKQSVISLPDVKSIYKIPIQLNSQKVDDIVTDKLRLSSRKPQLNDWKGVTEAHTNPTNEVTIAMVGKYMDLKDAYKSIIEASVHAGVGNKCKVNVVIISSDEITSKNVNKKSTPRR